MPNGIVRPIRLKKCHIFNTLSPMRFGNNVTNVFLLQHFQMFSETMGKLMLQRGTPEMEGMAKFILLIDHFFDILNISRHGAVQAIRQRKPHKIPFTDVNDNRLNVCLPPLIFYS